MRRALLLFVVLFAALAAPAGAHPLGNFSINHVAEVSASADRVDVRYLLDEAEIPTFQERGVPVAERVARKRAEVLRHLRVTADGRALPLVASEPKLELRQGAGGLKTTRFELALSGRVKARRVEVRDSTFPGRVGWHAIVARPGKATAVRSSVPATDPTRGLTRYPKDALSSPADIRTARLDVREGSGVVTAPGSKARGEGAGAEDGFAGLFQDAASGEGVLLLLLLAAFGWGAVHALSPGHGKAMVAAYLVGTRGTAKHAAALGATVTVTHTAGVLLLGVVALSLSAFVLPEDLYPWLSLASGLLVVGVGAAVLRKRARRKAAHSHHHDHGHHHHGPGGHRHAPEDLSARGILAMGASAGLIPCPSALVVLLGAVAQHQLALGLVMIVAFSLGLAATLTVLGIAVVRATKLPMPGRIAAVLPTVSAAVIVGVGLMLTAQAAGQIT